MVVVETLAQCELYQTLLDKLPEIKAVVTWGIKELPPHLKEDPRFYRFSDFLALGKDVSTSWIDAAENENGPGKCCGLFYTSGTSGKPKGVMLSHDNLVSNMITLSASLLENVPSGIQPENIRMISFLPLDNVSTVGFDLICNILWGS